MPISPAFIPFRRDWTPGDSNLIIRATKVGFALMASKPRQARFLKALVKQEARAGGEAHVVYDFDCSWLFNSLVLLFAAKITAMDKDIGPFRYVVTFLEYTGLLIGYWDMGEPQTLLASQHDTLVIKPRNNLLVTFNPRGATNGVGVFDESALLEEARRVECARAIMSRIEKLKAGEHGGRSN